MKAPPGVKRNSRVRGVLFPIDYPFLGSILPFKFLLQGSERKNSGAWIVEKEFTEYKIEVSVSDGALAAQVKVVPLASEVSIINEGDVYAALSESGVIFGLLPDAIRALVDQKVLGSTVEVAHGEPAGEGIDGYVRFHFEKDGRKVEAQAPKKIAVARAMMYSLLA